jgi:hypothetical protein
MLLGGFCVLNNFLDEQREEPTLDPEALPIVASVASDFVVDDITPLALNQYVDFDSECSGLFGDHEVEAAKRLLQSS